MSNSSWESFPEEEKSPGFELEFGVKWLSRLGIVALFIGVAMGLAYTAPMLPGVVKLIFGAILAILLWVAGSRLFGDHQVFGRILQCGGLSLGYLVAFAMGFIDETRMIHSPPVAWGGLGVYVGGMVVLAHRIRSQAFTALALLLGTFTSLWADDPASGVIAYTLIHFAILILSLKYPQWKAIAGLSAVTTYGVMPFYLFCQRVIIGGYDASLAHLLLIPNALALFAITLFQKRPWLNGVNTFCVYYAYRYAFPGIVVDILAVEAAILALQGFGLRRSFLRGESRTDVATVQLFLLVAFSTLGILDAFDISNIPLLLAVESVGLCMMLYLEQSRQGRGEEAQFNPLAHKGLQYGGLGILGLAACCSLLESFRFFGQEDVELVFTATVVAMAAFCWGELLLSPMRRMFLLLSTGYFAIIMMLHGNPHWIVPVYAVMGVGLVGLGIRFNFQSYRWVGLGWLTVAGLKLVFIDTLVFETPVRIGLYLLMGVLLLAGSYGYSRWANRLGRNLDE